MYIYFGVYTQMDTHTQPRNTHTSAMQPSALSAVQFSRKHFTTSLVLSPQNKRQLLSNVVKVNSAISEFQEDLNSRLFWWEEIKILNLASQHNGTVSCITMFHFPFAKGHFLNSFPVPKCGSGGTHKMAWYLQCCMWHLENTLQKN